LCVHQHLPVDRAAQVLADALATAHVDEDPGQPAGRRPGAVNHSAKPNYLHGRPGR
jgi:hypothetical protein